MSTVLVLAVLWIVSCVLHRYVIFPLFISPLAVLPNAHATSPLSSGWINWKRRMGLECRSILSAHRRHGAIVRLGPSEVSVASLNGLRQIYTGGFSKDSWYVGTFANYNKPNLVSMLDFQSHSKQKKVLTNVFSKSYLFASSDLQKMTSTILFKRLLPILLHAAEDDDVVDVFDLFKAVGMDFTTAYLFGIPNSTDLIRNVSTRRRYMQTYHIKSRKLLGHAMAQQQLEHDCLSLCEGALKLMEEQAAWGKSSAEDTYPVVFAKLYKELCHLQGLGKEQAMIQTASEMFDQMFAGLETTGITLTYLAYELSRRPELQSALRDELQGGACCFTLNNDGKLDSGNNSGMALAQKADSLSLLNAVVMETLRLYSPAPAPQPRIVPPGGTFIEGFFIPAGVKISTSAYCMHRNENVFPDPLVFSPERWLAEGKSSQGTETMRRWFWAFGSGGRMCIGSNLALHMLKATAAMIYSNFTTSVVDDTNIEQQESYIAGPVGGRLLLRFHATNNLEATTNEAEA